MLTFTLDTNCIIDLEENRPAAAAIRQLLESHSTERCSVAVVAVSASERQPSDRYMTNFREFRDRLERLGLGHLPMIYGVAYSDISFHDVSLWADEDDTRERQIHETMFPTIDFYWAEYASRNGADIDSKDRVYKKWRNAFCDRQMFWAHENAGREVFVTSNMSDFSRLLRSPLFPGARVATPREAACLLT